MARPVVIHVGPSLDARGGVVSVMRAYRDEPALGREFDLRFVASWKEGSRIAAIGTFLTSLAEVRRLCRACHGALVHVHMSSRGSFWRKRTLLRIAQANGASVLLHLHSGVFHRFADGGTFLRRRAIRRAFADADAVVVVSPEWRTWVTGFTGRSDVTVVPNPVTLPPRDAVGSLPPHVVFLGRLSRHKGVEVMLDAIRALQNAGVEATYTIAGHGRVERFRRLARALPEPGAVKVPGWLDDEAKSELLSRSDILCMPSYGEGAPVALLEGMAWGLGCVATAVGGVPSIITDRVHGLLVAPGDEHALAAVVRELLEDAGLRDRLGAAARGRVAERHDPRSTAETLATVYRTTHARRDAASGPASRAAVDMRGGRE